MGCTCGVGVAPTPRNYGGSLKWIYSGTSAENKVESVTWAAPMSTAAGKFCNPNNCSNSACHKKGCAQARLLFCKMHGYHCPQLGRKVCASDKCPGGYIRCLNSVGESIKYGNLPLCEGSGQTGAKPPKPPGSTYKPPAGCKCGCDIENPVLRTISCLGYNAGNFFTDAARSGNEQLPLFMLLGAGIILVLLLKR